MTTVGRRYVEFVDLTGLSRHTRLCPTDTGRVHGPMDAARVIDDAPAAYVSRVPVPVDFAMRHLCSGACSACAGTGRRDFPMPASHPRRIPGIAATACHDCRGTGKVHVHARSSIGAALRAASFERIWARYADAPGVPGNDVTNVWD